MVVPGHKLKIGIDLDGVTLDFLGSFLPFFKKCTGISVELSDVTDYYWRIGDNPDEMQRLLFEVFDKFSPEGFRGLSPKPCAVESIIHLNELGHDIRFITKRSSQVWDATVHSLEKYGIPFEPERLIFSQDKATLARKLQLDMHIDDHPFTAQEMVNAVDCSVCFDAPYNRDIENDKIIRVREWSEVLCLVENMK